GMLFLFVLRNHLVSYENYTIFKLKIALLFSIKLYVFDDLFQYVGNTAINSRDRFLLMHNNEIDGTIITDVLSLGDAGLRRAIKWLYGLGSSPGPDDMLKLGEKWQPYRTVASLYLWEAVNRDLCRQPLKD
ncbi:MAG: hypothetical protein ACOY3U_06955, partial [Bacillota bacterium]